MQKKKKEKEKIACTLGTATQQWRAVLQLWTTLNKRKGKGLM